MIPRFTTDPEMANAANREWAIKQLEAETGQPDECIAMPLTMDQKIDQMYQQMSQIMTVVENINNQVGPIMEQVKNHPIFSAFFGG